MPQRFQWRCASTRQQRTGRLARRLQLMVWTPPGSAAVSAESELTPISSNQRSKSADKHGRESLAQYILRSPFSQEKMTYRKDTSTVVYRSKMKPGSKKNFTVFAVRDWIATLTVHIPNKGEQLVRYYGYYSNVLRWKRGKLKPQREEAVAWKPEVIEVAPPPVSKELKKRSSYFISGD